MWVHPFDGPTSHFCHVLNREWWQWAHGEIYNLKALRSPRFHDSIITLLHNIMRNLQPHNWGKQNRLIIIFPGLFYHLNLALFYHYFHTVFRFIICFYRVFLRLLGFSFSSFSLFSFSFICWDLSYFIVLSTHLLDLSFILFIIVFTHTWRCLFGERRIELVLYLCGIIDHWFCDHAASCFKCGPVREASPAHWWLGFASKQWHKHTYIHT